MHRGRVTAPRPGNRATQTAGPPCPRAAPAAPGTDRRSPARRRRRASGGASWRSPCAAHPAHRCGCFRPPRAPRRPSRCRRPPAPAPRSRADSENRHPRPRAASWGRSPGPPRLYPDLVIDLGHRGRCQVVGAFRGHRCPGRALAIPSLRPAPGAAGTSAHRPQMPAPASPPDGRPEGAGRAPCRPGPLLPTPTAQLCCDSGHPLGHSELAVRRARVARRPAVPPPAAPAAPSPTAPDNVPTTQCAATAYSPTLASPHRGLPSPAIAPPLGQPGPQPPAVPAPTRSRLAAAAGSGVCRARSQAGRSCTTDHGPGTGPQPGDAQVQSYARGSREGAPGTGIEPPRSRAPTGAAASAKSLPRPADTLLR